MRRNQVRDTYTDRLTRDEIVYLVETEGFPKRKSGQLAIKKASVVTTDLHTNNTPDSIFVRLWNTIDKDPKERGFFVSKSPMELFTEEEALHALCTHEGPLDGDERPVDALIVDPAANREAAAILGGVLIWRISELEMIAA